MTYQPTYILAPHFRFKPGGPITIGNLIADPLRPHHALTTIDATSLETRYPRIETFTDQDYRITRSIGRDASMGVWSRFVDNITAKAFGERRTSSDIAYTMTALETRYFISDPPLEEITARLDNPRVQALMRASRVPGFRHPVYMVTGVMIAKGFSAVQKMGSLLSVDVEGKGSIPTPAGRIGAGVSMSQSTSRGGGDEWKTSEDVVFAYQVMKIEAKGWKGRRIEYDELRHKAAYLSMEEDNDSEDEEEEIPGEVTAQALDTADIRTLPDVTVCDVGERSGVRITCVSAIQ